MAIIDTEVRDGADAIEEGQTYEIVEVEQVITEAHQFSGIRVLLVTPGGDGGNVMLWRRKVTGKTSKLGAFLTLLGSDTDNWLGKFIKFVAWQENKREIELVAGGPAGKGKKS